jgi:TetR/AcrR family tetracycline transcriptional repressor
VLTPETAGHQTHRAGEPATRRTTLTRARVARAALALLDRDGLAKFSVRRLADYLSVTPMALYNHVNDKNDLLQAVAEAVLVEAECAPTSSDWRDIVRDCFRTLRQTCLAHPSVASLIQTADELPARVFQPMELIVNALHTAGLSAEEAARAYFVLITFTLGQARHQAKGWSHGVNPEAALRERRIEPSKFPAVAQAFTGQSWDFDEFFEFGLATIVAGLEAQIAEARAGA